MKLYYIEIPLTAVALYRIMAENRDDAIERALSGNAVFAEITNQVEDTDSNNWIIKQK